MIKNGQLDAHTAGTLALVGVAKAALGAMREAVADLDHDARTATRAVAEHATLLSKAAGSLAKKIDDLPSEHVAPPRSAAPDTGILAKSTDLLDRLNKLAQGATCTDCGLILPPHKAPDTR